MNASTLGHYQRVARNMNKYVRESAFNYYAVRDQGPIGVYQPSFYGKQSFGNRFANRLRSIGSRFGTLFD